MEDKIIKVFKEYYGENATFREGQYEAIKSTLNQRRTLVVQRTGWGKSLVYFICTKILREEGYGVTVVVSPLLVLMENQKEAADTFGMKTEVLNSTTKNRTEEIVSELKNDSVDLVFITPETLFSEKVQTQIKDIRIGLFVIDEAHCISDWGHDFRLEYGNLNKIISNLPQNVPILATTATANDRVVEDLKKQLGGNVYVSRGPLMRESLAIQVVRMPDTADRYTWILKNINSLPGTGIIYCLTQRDCEYLSDFLCKNDIPARSYYSRKGNDEEKNTEAIKLFSENKIKAIVATVKLGMGFDKGDVGFVIHFQQPSNIVSYYQQIGRAGRKLDIAYVILMSGKEDEKIIDYFIDTAFPTRAECESVVGIIENGEGVSENYILSKLNTKKNRIDKVLSFLKNEGAIYKQGPKYYATLKKYVYNDAHYKEVTRLRKKEKEQMHELINTDKCYLKFIVNALDDNTAVNCGKCANCLGHPLIGEDITIEEKEKALAYIDSLIIEIKPRKMWAKTSLTNVTKIEFVNNAGICLSKYGDVGYGRIVREDKYSKKEFSDILVKKSAEVLKEIIEKNSITHLTCVPSLRSDMVKKFAIQLSRETGLKFIDVLKKSDSKPQKEMQNSSHQCYNAYDSFSIDEGVHIPYNILLVDDMVDSGWTLTVCGYRLMQKGAKSVTPYALADSSQREDQEEGE